MSVNPTMNDIAAASGVSQATVSMVLNQRTQGRVSPSTAERVMATAEELGYRTNTHAKALREGRSRMIGFIGDEVATAPYAGQIIRGAQERAWQAEHVLLSVDTDGNSTLEQAAIDMMLGYRVVGIIYAAMYHRVVELPAALDDVPVVCVNAQDAAHRAPSIFPDEVQGGRDAAKALLEAGHRRIGMINIAPETQHLPAADGRLAGFREELAAHGVPLDDTLIVHGAGDHSSGLRLGRSLMKRDDPPTAIFCGNDRTALGCYRAVAELGLHAADDVSIIGFDDQDILTDCFIPALSTFALPFEEMGRLAVETLLTSPLPIGERRAVPCPAVPRASIARLTTHPKENRR